MPSRTPHPQCRRAVVAMIDSGARFGQPEFASRVVGGYDFVTSATGNKDGNGRDANPTDPGSA